MHLKNHSVLFEENDIIPFERNSYYFLVVACFGLLLDWDSMASMFCSDPRQERMEKDLLRNLKRTSANNPSRRNSILKSFVKELCFWEMNGKSHTREFAYAKKHRTIPTMKEATAMNNEYKHLTVVGSNDCVEKSPCSSTIWKSAIDLASGKIYYYDTISRKSQWKKVCKTKLNAKIGGRVTRVLAIFLNLTSS